MNFKNRIGVVGTTVVGASAICALMLGGCASSGEQATVELSNARWVRHAQPSFVTLERETLYALTHSEARDMLIFEQTEEGDRPLAAMRTWLVSLPQSPRMNSAMEVGDGQDVQAWVVTAFPGMRARSVEARGRVSVVSSDGESLTAQVNIEGHGPAPTAGYGGPSRVALDGQFVFQRMTPATGVAVEPPTESGTAAPAKKK